MTKGPPKKKRIGICENTELISTTIPSIQKDPESKESYNIGQWLPPTPNSCESQSFFHQRWREEEAQGQGWRKEVRKKSSEAQRMSPSKWLWFCKEISLI